MARYRETTTQKYESELPRKKKWSYSFEGNTKEIDLKDVKLLSRYTTERGKILPRRITGLTAQQQKKVARAIKRARQMSLLPYISYGFN